MKLPFSTEQFLKVFSNYNQAVWPFQIVLYAFGILAIVVLRARMPYSNKIISAILAFFWIWMGLVYHLIYFSTINKAAYIFAVAFVMEGVLIFYAGALKQTLSFRFHSDPSGITGGFLLFFSLLLYPILGYFHGHIYPASPTFGLPCPTTIFTFGILLWTDKKIPLGIILVAVAWSLIGFTAAFLLGMWEDIGLLISSLLFITFTLIRNHQVHKPTMIKQE